MIRPMFAESSTRCVACGSPAPVRIAADGRHAAAPIEVGVAHGAKIMAVIDTMVFDDDGRISSRWPRTRGPAESCATRRLAFRVPFSPCGAGLRSATNPSYSTPSG